MWAISSDTHSSSRMATLDHKRRARQGTNSIYYTSFFFCAVKQLKYTQNSQSLKGLKNLFMEKVWGGYLLSGKLFDNVGIDLPAAEVSPRRHDLVWQTGSGVAFSNWALPIPCLSLISQRILESFFLTLGLNTICSVNWSCLCLPERRWQTFPELVSQLLLWQVGEPEALAPGQNGFLWQAHNRINF